MAEKLSNNRYMGSPLQELEKPARKRNQPGSPTFSLSDNFISNNALYLSDNEDCEYIGSPRSKQLKVTEDVERHLAEKTEAVFVQTHCHQTPTKSSPSPVFTTPENQINKFGATVPVNARKGDDRDRLSVLPFNRAAHQLLNQEQHPFPAIFHGIIKYNGEYQSAEGVYEACIQQPGEAGSCGAGTTAMLLTHYLKKDSTLQIEESFGKWYQKVHMIKPKQLMKALREQTNLNALGYVVKAYYYSDRDIRSSSDSIKDWGDDLYAQLRELHESLNAPVLLDITNPVIGNHWIVVDRITETAVSIRDPYTGNAYTIPKEEFLKNTPEQIAVSCVYLESSNSSKS